VSVRVTQFSLIIAGVGAVLILLGILGTAASLIGLAAVLIGTALSASAGRSGEDNWWSLLAIGATLSVIGALLSIASQSIGGLVALIGCVAVLAGAAFGYPR
jgi:hypothetical protein